MRICSCWSIGKILKGKIKNEELKISFNQELRKSSTENLKKDRTL